MQSLLCCGLGALFRVGFQSLLQFFGSTPKPIFLFGELFKKWYSTDVLLKFLQTELAQFSGVA
jgi:hypothetical protein